MVALGRRSWSPRSGSSWSSPRASCPARTPGRSSASPRRPRASPSRPWSSTSRPLAAIVRQDPNVDAFMPRASAPAAPTPRATRAGSSSGSRPRTERELSRRRGHPGAAAEAGAGARASASSCRTRRPSASAASSPRASTSSRCRGRTRTSSTARPRSWRRSCATLPGLQDVTSDLQIQNPQVNVEIDRDRALALGVTAAADRGRALHRLRQPPDLHDLRAEQRVPGDPGAAAGVPARPVRPRRCSTSAPRTGSLVPLERRGAA